ncbi:MAG TPA: PaaI family thioesterase [Rhodocyclaceae bacterium]|nr:PaaI family thioesterase [Rhodocyclaceae bacterium]
MTASRYLQDMAAPDGTCFGCGSAHPSGLHLKSYWDDDGVHVICKHTPRPEFIGWPGLVYGGFIAMLVDCHSNWTVMAYHYRNEGRAPGTQPKLECATGNLNITYLKPTPMGVELTLKARVEGPVGRKTRVLCEVRAGDLLTVTADSIFVRVDPAQLRVAAHAGNAR